MNIADRKKNSFIVLCLLIFTCAANTQKTKNSIWIKQKEQTNIYRFELAVIEWPHDGLMDFVPHIIKVINKKNKHITQLIDLSEEFMGNVLQPATALSVIDCNFDGYKDLMIYSHDGGAGPNIGYDFYLYNPIKKRFEFNDQLSDLSQTEVDSKTKTIRSSWRAGAASHGGETYGFIKGKFTMLESWNDECAATYPVCYSIKGKLVKGKWIETSNIFTYTGDSPVFIYNKPINNLAPVDSVKNGNTVTIIKEYPKWAWAGYYNNKTTKKNGWVKKDAFFSTEGKWVKQLRETDSFSFELIRGLLKVNKKLADTCHQLIIGVFAENETDSVLQTGDYNFDGEKDIAIRMSTDKSDLIPYEIFDEEKYKLFYDYYLYNPAKQVFEKDTLLSKLANLTVDDKEKCVISKDWEMPEPEKLKYSIKKYAYVKQNKWLLTEQTIIKSLDDGYMQYNGKLQSNRWLQNKKKITVEAFRKLMN